MNIAVVGLFIEMFWVLLLLLLFTFKLPLRDWDFLRENAGQSYIYHLIYLSQCHPDESVSCPVTKSECSTQSSISHLIFAESDGQVLPQVHLQPRCVPGQLRAEVRGPVHGQVHGLVQPGLQGLLGQAQEGERKHVVGWHERKRLVERRIFMQLYRKKRNSEKNVAKFCFRVSSQKSVPHLPISQMINAALDFLLFRAPSFFVTIWEMYRNEQTALSLFSRRFE